jgi:predicted DsbA family dithiol-disulfide isomerase
MQERLRQVAAAEGVPLAERSRTCNSRRAQELGKWAEEQGRGEVYHRAVYHAYFVEGRNIVLVDELNWKSGTKSSPPI